MQIYANEREISLVPPGQDLCFLLTFRGRLRDCLAGPPLSSLRSLSGSGQLSCPR